jgi:hypothetical protein
MGRVRTLAGISVFWLALSMLFDLRAAGIVGALGLVGWSVRQLLRRRQ